MTPLFFPVFYRISNQHTSKLHGKGYTAKYSDSLEGAITGGVIHRYHLMQHQCTKLYEL